TQFIQEFCVDVLTHCEHPAAEKAASKLIIGRGCLHRDLSLQPFSGLRAHPLFATRLPEMSR
ncbi:MAG TPA: hypothetical protein VGI23_12995, partial [Steroidobacteraceae bacterium]